MDERSFIGTVCLEGHTAGSNLCVCVCVCVFVPLIFLLHAPVSTGGQTEVISIHPSSLRHNVGAVKVSPGGRSSVGSTTRLLLRLLLDLHRGTGEQ